MRRLRIGAVAGAMLLLLSGMLLYVWFGNRARDPRLCATDVLVQLDKAIREPANSERLPAQIVLPPSVATRTIAEQVDFARKALRDEISHEGIEALRQHAQFGQALDVFPDQAVA
ncbi:MAG: hypothetical protein JXQ75_21345 [Phycisphaerae bacterium]|nr:hypothetical protein [Phycisphaerae bacterium]